MIDGFDADKFRKVNNRSDFSQAPPVSVMSVNKPSAPLAVHAEEKVVPTYDMKEQQLLQSLEQELGVL